ncbi:MAG TPA: sigma-70 family RNA polymerase sigma factor [Kofleriaceae bacterium]|nr:sigma-70 family RNA polymerase sigma factor [Kofleriaceae bacterium]
MSKPLSLHPAATSSQRPEREADVGDPASEAALVAACQRGERPAMHELYQRYRRRVFALIARITGAQEAEELTQDVFLRAFRGIARFRGDAQLSTWMYRLAVNAALSHATRAMTRARKNVPESELLQVPAPASTGPEGPHGCDPRLRERLQAAMAALPAGYRAVLVLHDIEGLQHDEIADILGCRVGTSKSQLHKARAKMRDILGNVREGVT